MRILHCRVVEKADQQILKCHGLFLSQLERLAFFDVVRVSLIAVIQHLGANKLSFPKMYLPTIRRVELAEQVVDVWAVERIAGVIDLEVKMIPFPLHCREFVSRSTADKPEWA